MDSARTNEQTTTLDAEGDALEAFGGDDPQPEFDPDAGRLTTDDLSDIGRSSDLFRSFSRGYDAEDVPLLHGELLRVLAHSAGAAGTEVEACAGTLPQNGTLLPVYGALGEYEGRDVLVLGFVTSDTNSSKLDRYLMWVWARGNCRQPIDTLFEEIDAP